MICVQCTTPFLAYPSHERTLCGMECYRAWQRAGNAKGRTRTVMDVACSTCGKLHHPTGAKKRDGTPADNNYCSLACYMAEHQRKISWTCEGCGETSNQPQTWSGKNPRKYCSHECKVKSKKADPVNCKQCGVWFSSVQFRVTPSHSYTVSRTNATCTRECLRAFFRTNQPRKDKIGAAFAGEKHPAWKGGASADRGFGWAKIAEAARERAGRCCHECGIPEKETGRKLDVHHIVPYHNFDSARVANKSSNLMALCKPCHMRMEHKAPAKQIVFDFAHPRKTRKFARQFPKAA